MQTLLGLLLWLTACGSTVPPHVESLPAPVRRSVKKPTVVAPWPQVLPKSPTVPAVGAAICEPCSNECLDAADTVKLTDPAKAKQLAMQDCDLSVCGYIGRAFVPRCHEYGIFPGT